MLSKVHWRAENFTLAVADDWTALADDEGGFRSARLRVAKWHELPEGFGQGAEVCAYTDQGDCLWHGQLPGDPRIVQGVAEIGVAGFVTGLEKRNTRRLFQSYDTGPFVDEGDKPYSNSYNKNLDAELKGPALAFRVNTETYSTGHAHGLILEAVEAEIKRYAWKLDKNRDINSFDLRFQRFTAPGGPKTTCATTALDATNADGATFSVTISDADAENSLLVEVRCNAGGSPVTIGRVFVRDFRYNDIAPGDSYLASDIATHIAGQLGYDTSGIVVTTGNVLPQDWRTFWAEGMDYNAMLADYHWGIYEPVGGLPSFVFAPYATNWTGSQSSGVHVEQLDKLEKISKATVFYPGLNGNELEVTKLPTTDPGTNLIVEESLEDVQPNDDLAQVVAQRLVDYYSTDLYIGKLMVVNARNDAGVEGIIRPGHLFTLEDLGPGQSIQQRIQEVEYSIQGTAVGVGRATSFVEAEMKLPTAHSRRRRRRRPRHRRRHRRPGL